MSNLHKTSIFTIQSKKHIYYTLETKLILKPFIYLGCVTANSYIALARSMSPNRVSSSANFWNNFGSKHSVYFSNFVRNNIYLFQQIINSHLHPRGAILWPKFQKLFVQYSTPVEFTQLNFQVNVSPEKFVPRANTQCHALYKTNIIFY